MGAAANSGNKAFGLVAIGEAMAELRQSEGDGFNVGFAGDTFNTAVYCARSLDARAAADSAADQKKSNATSLNIEQTVSYVTYVGHDPLSTAFVELVQSEHINADHITRHNENNLGIYSVTTDQAGERSFHYWRSNSAARQLYANDETPVALPAARVVYLSGISLAIMQPSARHRLIDHLKTLSETKQSLLAFDSNYRPQLWESQEVAQSVMTKMWSIADIALPSIDDEMNLFGDASEAAVIERFGSSKRTLTAIKRGSRGPVSPDLPEAEHPHFEPATNVVDTTAAGDSFNGGLLAAFLMGASQAECMVAGHECASMVVGVRGAIAPRYN